MFNFNSIGQSGKRKPTWEISHRAQQLIGSRSKTIAEVSRATQNAPRLQTKEWWQGDIHWIILGEVIRRLIRYSRGDEELSPLCVAIAIDTMFCGITSNELNVAVNFRVCLPVKGCDREGTNY